MTKMVTKINPKMTLKNQSKNEPKIKLNTKRDAGLDPVGPSMPPLPTPLGHCTCFYQRQSRLRRAFRHPSNLPCTLSQLANFPLYPKPTSRLSCDLFLVSCTRSRAAPPCDPNPQKSDPWCSLAVPKVPLCRILGQLFDFFEPPERDQKRCFLGTAPKGQKSHNQWPKVAQVSIFGPISNDFGKHFGIDF